MQYLSYLFFRFGIFVFSLIPFRLMYGLSNGLVWVFSDLLKYRRNVIQKNLEISFPDKTQAERDEIAKQFYQNLTDITLESIKGLSTTQEVMMSRFKFTNPELLRDYYDKNQSLLLVGGHFGNWEWGARVINPWLDHTVLGIFKPLKNPYINKYVTNLRGKWDTILVPVKETRKAIVEYEGQNAAFAFVADQTPSNMITTIWVDFMGRESAFAPGPEKIAQAYNFPVYYFDISRAGRGYYQVELVELCKDPSQLKETELTQIFARKVEEAIRRAPADWLWSHKRWKHERGVEKSNVYS